MKTYEATTTIQASPEVVWSILTEASAYPEWDPNCTRMEGTIALGEQLTAFTALSPGRAFRVKVTAFEPGRRMTWSSGMPLGLFKGERTFALKPNGAREVEFTVKEVFSGPMMLLIGGTIPDLNQPFEQFVEGLKARAEAQGE
ncbi:MAG: SRPBCC domain-containing protein [Myxococcota bacterium]